jgi:hypothetical protein
LLEDYLLNFRAVCAPTLISACTWHIVPDLWGVTNTAQPSLGCSCPGSTDRLWPSIQFLGIFNRTFEQNPQESQ